MDEKFNSEFCSLFARLVNDKIAELRIDNAALRREIEQLKRHKNNKNGEK